MDYRVRIFTPSTELPFAGHPTLGTCHAWLRRRNRLGTDVDVAQECAIGRVDIKVRGQISSFSAPIARVENPRDDLLTAVEEALGLDPTQVLAAAMLDNGSRWLGLLLDGADTVRRLIVDHVALKPLCKVGVIGRNRPGQETAFEVRAFAPSVGVPEDPVTGSLNASLAQWLMARGDAPSRYVASQGGCIGRSGEIHIVHEGGQLWVGGHCAANVSGTVEL